MNYLLSIVTKKNLGKSIVKKLVPVKVQKKIILYLKKDIPIKLYFENNTNYIDCNDKKLQSLIPVLLKFSIPVYYWDGRPNFGDLIGPYIISKITNKPVINIKDLNCPGIMSIGSIIQMIDRKDMIIWGSGLMHKPSSKQTQNIKKYSPKVLSLRGRETAKCLLEANINIPDNVVYGDPALILPLFYTPLIIESKNIGICPHYTHKMHFLTNISDHNTLKIIDVQKDVETVVNDICSSSVCISTSLHGLIIAQAYGVPWVWLEICDDNLGGEDFKFKDFFSTIDESQVSHIKVNVQEVSSLDYKAISEKAKLPDKLYNEELILESLKSYLNLQITSN